MTWGILEIYSIAYHRNFGTFKLISLNMGISLGELNELCTGMVM